MGTLATSKGVFFISDATISYPNVSIKTPKGILTYSSLEGTPEIIGLTPADGSYNNALTSIVSFVISKAGDVNSGTLYVSLNAVNAIESGSFANGYTGSIVYDSDLFQYTVSIAPSINHPPFVGVTISFNTSGSSYSFSSSFKTKNIDPLLKTSQGAKNIFSYYPYVFIATNAGLDVIDIRTQENIAYALNSSGYTSVCGTKNHDSLDTIYLGTLTNGIFKILLSDIKIGGDVSQFVSQEFSIYSSPALSNNNIIDMHLRKDKLAVLLPNNVNFIDITNATIFNNSFVGTISKGCVFLSEDTTIYFSNNFGLNVKYLPVSDWSNSDYTYSTPQIGSNNINKIFVADYTASPSTHQDALGNTVFVATSDGAYVINENRSNEVSSFTKSFGISGKDYNILDSNICTAVAADRIEKAEDGRIYVGTDSKFFIINNISNVVTDMYDVSTGKYGDYLNYHSTLGIATL